MATNRAEQRIPAVAAIGLVAATTLPLIALTVGSDSPDVVAPPIVHAAAGRQDSTGDSSQETTRLYFLNASWPKVIEKVARETDSEPVIQRAPRGRFTRIDHRLYSRSDAVRIINQELEPKGFRLLEQGKHLVLLDLDKLRSRYGRPTLPSDSADSTSLPEETVAEVAAQQGHRRNGPGVGIPAPSGPPRSAQAGRQPSGIWRNARDGDRSVVTAGSNRRAASEPRKRIPEFLPATAHNEENQATEADADASAKPPFVGTDPSITLQMGRRSAVEISKIIYGSLKSRSQLVDAGPKGLPAFRVFEKEPGRVSSENGSVPAGPDMPTAGRDVAFVIGIDTARNELVIEAPEERRAALVRLVREIDKAKVPDGGVIRLVSSHRDAAQIASRLRPVVRNLVAQNRADAGRRDGSGQQDGSSAAAADLFQPPADGNQPGAVGRQEPPVQAPTPLEGGLPLRIQGPRGPVTIRDVPGIGLVVTGNREDVEAVFQLIQELERVARGQVPDIHLLLLQHVNSEALAGLLNTVYEELTQLRALGAQQRPSASIIAVVKPNALLIVGPQGDITTIEELARQLDKPIDPKTEFQVFHLKHAIAAQVVETLTAVAPEQPPEEAGELRTRIRAVADARTNSIIVQAAPRDLEEVARLIEKIDRDWSGSVSRMKVFPLKNALAEDLAEVINSAIQSVLTPAGVGAPGQVGAPPGAAAAGGETAQQLQDVKSVVLEFLTNNGQAEQLVRSGILADIRVTADARANSLIVTAPEQSMSLMAELIRQLDQPSSMVADIKVFTLANADASAMADLLQTLFEPEQEDQAGIVLAGAEDVSSSLVPLRFSVDIRTNSLIAIGGPEALRVVEAILLRLDETDVRQRISTVVRLNNAPAIEVADAINAFLQSQRDLAQIDPELISNIELLEREIIVVPEPINNSLLISATKRYYQEILDIIQELDTAPPQVVIQVLIVEVELDNTDEFGVELGFQDSILFNRGLLNPENFITITETMSTPGTGIATTTERVVNEERIPGFLFNNQQLGNNTSINPSSIGTQGLSNFSLGRINGDLGFGGLVLSASSESISVLIRALAAQRNVHILSRPQITTLDNQLAQIQVGQQVPVISGATTNALGGITPTIGTPQQVGIILQVTPRIRPDGTIVMETIANKSAISGQGVPIITDPTTGVPVESPIFDLTEAQSTVAVPDGQTIVLGGMITKTDDTIERKVPWLGDLPLLGIPFRYDATQTRRTELLIFMTPRIVHNDIDAELIKQVESERVHFIEQEAEEIHGPIFAVPAEQPLEETAPPPTAPPNGDSVVPPLPEDGAEVPTTIMPSKPLHGSRPLPDPSAARSRPGTVPAAQRIPRPPQKQNKSGNKAGWLKRLGSRFR